MNTGLQPVPAVSKKKHVNTRESSGVWPILCTPYECWCATGVLLVSNLRILCTHTPNIPNLPTWKSSIPSFQLSRGKRSCPGSTEVWVDGWEPSNRVCGARGAAAHACAPGLSTGRRLMPMPARCDAAAPCRGAATVRRSPHTRRILRRVLLGRGCLCGAHMHRARVTASTTKRLHACACEGADENSWQSRPRHALGAGRRLAARNRAATY